MKKLWSKKIKGDSTYIATIICVFFLMVLMVGLLDQFEALVKMNDVIRVHRKYLLEMERDGYLTDEKENLMLTELAGYGVENIDISGTSKTAVGYGNLVRLVIKGNIKVKTISFAGSSPAGAEETWDVNIDKTGAALY